MFINTLQNLLGKPWFPYLTIFIVIVIYILWEKFSDTIDFQRWLIKINPNNYNAHSSLGMHLSENIESYDEAEKEFQRAIELNPTDVKNYHLLYSVLIFQKKDAEAGDLVDKLL